ncbi:MAG: Crp/Fnr family transcriptional regulator [Bacteroidia bacterium]
MGHACQTTEENPFRIMDIIPGISDHLEYKKGQLIYCEGSTPLGIYFVQEGMVKIYKLGSDTKEQIVRIATPEEMLSYVDLISNIRYTTSARALENTVLLFVPKQEFWKTIKEHMPLFENFVLLLSMDLRQAEDKITNLAYTPVRGRLADALITLEQKFHKDQKMPAYVSLTRSDLACFVGTAKETVNRLLSDFRHEGLVSTEGTKINILNLPGLIRVSNMYH